MFRFELTILLGFILLMDLWSGRVTIRKVIGHVIPAGVVWLGK